MADPGGARSRIAVRLAQLLLVVAAGALWAAARLPWVVIRSFDGLGQPKQVTVSGASWSTAVPPLAWLSLAAAIAALAVRGWRLRILAVLMAVSSLAAGYLAISIWVVGDVAVRAADIADVALGTLSGSDRHYAGAAFTLVASLCMLSGAVLLMRSASAGGDGAAGAGKYVSPGARRARARQVDAGPAATQMSERMLWDALDEGDDPTDDPTGHATGADQEGR